MAWYKCFSSNGSPAPSEWDWEIYNVDFSSSDPDDDIKTGYPLTVYGEWDMLINLDTNAPAYDNNNNIGLFTLVDEPTPEPDAVDASIELVINSYQLLVFIRGRLCFSDDTDHSIWGSVTGSSKNFVGDYRNVDIKIESRLPQSGFSTITVKAKNGNQFDTLCSIDLLGYPHWNESHTEIISDSKPTNNHLVIGSWYGGAGRHEFDGHLNYFKFKIIREE